MQRCIPAAIGVAVAMIPVAFAHQTAFWIMENPQTQHCCGPDDCKPDTQGMVEETPAGWRVRDTSQFFARSQFEWDNVYLSIDRQFWTCRVQKPAGDLNPYSRDGWVKCLFVPGMI